jgi:hypothetical protein
LGHWEEDSDGVGDRDIYKRTGKEEGDMPGELPMAKNTDFAKHGK